MRANLSTASFLLNLVAVFPSLFSIAFLTMDALVFPASHPPIAISFADLNAPTTLRAAESGSTYGITSARWRAVSFAARSHESPTFWTLVLNAISSSIFSGENPFSSKVFFACNSLRFASSTIMSNSSPAGDVWNIPRIPDATAPAAALAAAPVANPAAAPATFVPSFPAPICAAFVVAAFAPAFAPYEKPATSAPIGISGV